MIGMNSGKGKNLVVSDRTTARKKSNIYKIVDRVNCADEMDKYSRNDDTIPGY